MVGSLCKKRIFQTVLVIVVLSMSFFLTGCGRSEKNQSHEIELFSSFRDIPDITDEEIAAIEALQGSYDYFIYGMPLSTETFINSRGELKGFTALFTEWLSGLFEIEFRPELMEWADLLEGLESGGAQFSGELTPTPARVGIYDMTSPIAMRPLMVYRLEDSEPVSDILAVRPFRTGFIQGTATISAVALEMPDGDYEVVELENFSFVYDALQSGTIDAFYYSAVAELSFIEYEDLVSSEFFPLIFMPVSLTTQTPELAPVITIIEKAMQSNDTRRYISGLYNDGYNEYLRHKLFVQLTEEERQFISQRPEILFAAENDNYPLSFYDTHGNDWQGIAIDVLHEVESLTGLTFNRVNDENATFADLVKGLSANESSLITDLMYTEQRSYNYLWTDANFLTSRSALISKADHRDVTLNDILHLKVAVIEGYAHTEFFHNWFPNHPGAIEYESILSAIDALDRDEVDTVMIGDSSILLMTHYLERPGYKIIHLFDNPFTSTFGFNRNEVVLHSIMNKAIRLVNTEMITEHWVRKTYDFQSRIVDAQRPWIFGAFGALLFIVIFMTVAYYRGLGKRRLIIEQAGTLNELFAKLNVESKRFKESAHWYMSILDAIPLPISVTDRYMNWTFVNKAVEEFLDTTRESLMGRPCSEWNAHICNTSDCGIACAKRGIFRTFFDNKNSSYQVDVEILRDMDGDISGFIEVVQDISTIQHLIKQRTEAEIANETKTTFLANMSHEIRTPMNSIVGFSELALDDAISPRTKKYLNNILVNSEGLLQIINDILDISKIESGKMELEHVPFELTDLLSSCRTIILPKAKDKGLKLVFYAEPPTGKLPLGDPTRMRQVLVNLLSNAVKFTDKGTVKLHFAISAMTEDSITVYVEVQDSGIGMTQSQIKDIFTPFTQAESETTRKYGGTGLGLAITKNLLEMMGTELIVESIPGEGSTFCFEITFDTIDIPEEEMLDKKLVQSKLDKPTFEGEVLLCEDNSMNQQVICEHLARVGLKTVVAENGRIGVDLVRYRAEADLKQFDLIFMDMHMPEMDGLEASKIIKDMNTGIPIVVMTANIMSSDRDLYEKNGMSGYVGKPFTSQELWRCLLKYFEPINWQVIDEIQQHQADAELRPKLIQRFLENNSEKFREISDALEADDITLAHRLVHTLKSNAAQLSKSALRLVAAEVEDNLKDGINLVTPSQLLSLKIELASVINEFKTVAEDQNILVDTKTVDSETAYKTLTDLEPLLRDSDLECLTFAKDLMSIPGSEELVRQMENFEFMPALEALLVLKGTLGGDTNE